MLSFGSTFASQPIQLTGYALASPTARKAITVAATLAGGLVGGWVGRKAGAIVGALGGAAALGVLAWFYFRPDQDQVN